MTRPLGALFRLARSRLAPQLIAILSVAILPLGSGSEKADLLLFDTEGDFLATEDFSDDRQAVLPQNRTLKELAQDKQQTFRAKNRRGEMRDFAVVSIVDDIVFVLGSWEPATNGP